MQFSKTMKCGRAFAACIFVITLVTSPSEAGDGSIVGWGRNGLGQCDVPAPNTDFVAVAAGVKYSLGLKADGSIVAWGNNRDGQIDVPAPNADFVAVAASWYSSLGLKADGSIVGWGDDYYALEDVPAPNTNFVAVSAGAFHGMGLKVDSSIVVWSHTNHGRRAVPAPNTDFVALAGGSEFSLGLKADGSIVAWGRNYYGQTDVPAPNADFVAVAAGTGHSLGLKANGSIVAWGHSTGGRTDVPTPNSDFVGIAAGDAHSVGLKSDGSIVAWGRYYYGQTDVPALDVHFVAVAGGYDHSLGLMRDPSCGDGVADDGEDCDSPDSDCCDSLCNFKAAGTACTDDGNPCTGGACVLSTCVHTPIPGCRVCMTGDECQDGKPCTADGCLRQGDLLGFCVRSNYLPGSPCPYDGDSCTDDVCDSAGTCGHPPRSECGPLAYLDIKPGSCPNPVNPRSRGVVPMAIVGSESFDVAEIDVDSLTLARADGVGGIVTPITGNRGPRVKMEDVATPFDGEACDCHALGGDGIDDLTLKFSTPDLVEALELESLSRGESVMVTLSGTLLDGTVFETSDCIVIPGKNSSGGLRRMRE